MNHPTPQGQLSDERIRQIYADETGFRLEDSPAALMDFARAIEQSATESLRAEVEALRAVALEAADVIEPLAEDLRDGHSVDGEWRITHPVDEAAKAIYERDIALVKRLRALSQQSGSEVKK